MKIGQMSLRHAILDAIDMYIQGLFCNHHTENEEMHAGIFRQLIRSYCMHTMASYNIIQYKIL